MTRGRRVAIWTVFTLGAAALALAALAYREPLLFRWKLGRLEAAMGVWGTDALDERQEQIVEWFVARADRSIPFLRTELVGTSFMRKVAVLNLHARIRMAGHGPLDLEDFWAALEDREAAESVLAEPLELFIHAGAVAIHGASWRTLLVRSGAERTTTWTVTGEGKVEKHTLEAAPSLEGRRLLARVLTLARLPGIEDQPMSRASLSCRFHVVTGASAARSRQSIEATGWPWMDALAARCASVFDGPEKGVGVPLDDEEAADVLRRFPADMFRAQGK